MTYRILNKNTPYGIECINNELIRLKIARRIPRYISMFDDIVLADYQYVIVLVNGSERVVKQFKTDYSGIDITNPDQREEREYQTVLTINDYILHEEGPTDTFFIKLEDGSYILLENKSKFLLENYQI